MAVMSDSDNSKNLSEILFKPRFEYLETSMISNSGCELPPLAYRDPALGFAADWYRPVRTFMWVFLGGNLLDIDEALSNISSSKNPRKRELCFDTVAEYGPGNWIYEFNSIAQKRVNAAKEQESQGDILGASHNYRMASRYFTIAAYPFLRGDVLANESLMHSRRFYKKMIEMDPNNGEISEELFAAGGTKVSGFLHLPDRTSIHPCVIMAGSYEQNITDYYRFYNDYLRPKGIALFAIDMPGIASSSKLNLSADLSIVVDSAIEYLKNLKYIDATHLGLLGMRIAGSACIRSCILNHQAVKALAVIAPAVHSLFTDKDVLNSLPLCLRSNYANRLNLDASNWDTIIPQLQVLSLKTQGLLSASGRCSVPCSVYVVKNSLVTNDDLKLLEANFKDCRINMHENTGYTSFLLQSYDSASRFFESLLLEKN